MVHILFLGQIDSGICFRPPAQNNNNTVHNGRPPLFVERSRSHHRFHNRSAFSDKIVELISLRDSRRGTSGLRGFGAWRLAVKDSLDFEFTLL